MALVFLLVTILNADIAMDTQQPAKHETDVCHLPLP